MRALTIIIVVTLLFVGAFVVGETCWWANETIEVVHEEFGPRALLAKYEWFKDASATLDKKVADITVLRGNIESLSSMYEGQSRSEWSRYDLQEYNLLTAELRGLIASYNTLASTYNSEMVKFNWRFANRGELPEGAEEPLPREYKPYNYQLTK